jgi:hypothetical protein
VVVGISDAEEAEDAVDRGAAGEGERECVGVSNNGKLVVSEGPRNEEGGTPRNDEGDGQRLVSGDNAKLGVCKISTPNCIMFTKRIIIASLPVAAGDSTD